MKHGLQRIQKLHWRKWAVNAAHFHILLTNTSMDKLDYFLAVFVTVECLVAIFFCY
jgi:hypothetical protein